jgi:hypothetical protein
MKTRPLPDDAANAITARLGEILEDCLRDVPARAAERLADTFSEIAIPEPEPRATTPLPLQRAVSAIREGRGQAAVLRSVLGGSASLGARAALFVVRGDVAELWESIGFEDDPLSDQTGLCTIATDDPSLSTAVVDRRSVFLDAGENARFPSFGQSMRREAAIIPMQIQGRVLAVLYVDPANDDESLDLAGLELLAEVAALAVERLALARVIAAAPHDDASPRMSGPVSAMGSEVGMGPEVGMASEVGMGSGASPATTDSHAAAPAWSEPAPSANESASFEMHEELDDVPPPRPARDEFGSHAPQERPPSAADLLGQDASTPPTSGFEPADGGFDLEPEAPEMPAAPAAPAAPPEPSFSAPEPPLAMPAESEPHASAPEPPLAAPAPSEPAEESQEVQDARRFARLVIEEICLYHGTRVEEGRERGDLLERLADEIERARQLYDQRIPQHVREQGDFFGDALVQVLAAGNPAALA